MRAGDFPSFQLLVDKQLVSSKPMTKPKHIKKFSWRLGVNHKQHLLFVFLRRGFANTRMLALGPWSRSVCSLALVRLRVLGLVRVRALPAVQKPHAHMLEINWEGI